MNRTGMIAQSLRLLRELKQLNLAEQLLGGQDIDRDINALEDKILRALEELSFEDTTPRKRRGGREGRKGQEEKRHETSQLRNSSDPSKPLATIASDYPREEGLD